MTKKTPRIGILTGGGDCPGLNAALRGVAKAAMNEYGMEVVGIFDGYQGLIKLHARKLKSTDVSGILTLGGTILGTSNRANPFANIEKHGGKLVKIDRSEHVLKNCKKLGLDALVAIGGDGTLSIANELGKRGVNVVGVPKTIDNDLCETDLTFGFDSAVQIATDGIDRLHTTAQSHHRVMVIELMGRNAGWLTLHAGVAGGADVILIPEIPYGIDCVAACCTRRSKVGKRFTIIAVSEGAKPKGGKQVVKRMVETSFDPVRLGGVGRVVADQIEAMSGIESRAVVLGHLQRGGSPTAFDRVLATRFGTEAARLVATGRFRRMVCLKGADITSVPIEKAVVKQRLVPRSHEVIRAARAVGTSFGDE
ncbi:MAG: ATP-dependent 6-phosphofructokinase [Planctomycetes bacterium]|nr:ATP-dependent 6-phosphofructokinase [Planctomycetota bacterium]